MVNPFNGAIFGHKMEWSADSYYKDETQKHYTKPKTPDTKGHILFDSVYMKFQGLEGEENGEWLLMGMRFLLRVIQMFWN